VVATPVRNAAAAMKEGLGLLPPCPTLRKSFSMELLEGVGGSFEPHGQVELTGLDPEAAYRISIGIVDDDRGAIGSFDVTLPQRANPSKWTPQEALQWCASMQVPEFTRKAKEYCIDGATLLSLGEEDLRALGLVVPFMLKRVLAGLDKLRNG